MVVVLHYKAQLNAALNVKVLNLPINSWEDIAASEFKVLIWIGSAVETFFKLAEEGTAMKEIYDNKILAIPVTQHLNGISYSGSIPKMLDDSSVTISELEVFELMKEYPCEVIDVKTLQ
jgi:hypothetical protein